MSLLTKLTLGMIGIGVVLRLFSAQWNFFTHGDVLDDIKAGVSFQREQTLVIEQYGEEEGYHYDIARTNGMKLLMQHPPLWPIAGALVSTVARFEADIDSVFFSFKILSLLSGITLLLLAWKVVKTLGFDEWACLWIVSALSLSFIMVDYSGNGAFYGLHGILYLLWIQVAYSNPARKAVWFALLAGTGYLLNFPCIILVPASLLMLLLLDWRDWKKFCIDAAVFLGISAAIVTPYLLRNWNAFGDPFFPHFINQTYVYIKASVPRTITNGIISYDLSPEVRLRLLTEMLTYSLPNNLYYVFRKLFILTPIAFLFVPFALIDYLWSRERLRKMAPVLILLALHVLLTTAWPVVKFRYFVPMLPLVYFIAFEHMQIVLQNRTVRTWTGVACVATTLTISILAFHSTPTHTAYYDGAVTTDPFGDHGERVFLRESGIAP